MLAIFQKIMFHLKSFKTELVLSFIYVHSAVSSAEGNV